ncbi:hypothetical protein ABTF26_20690, partial [Acinetobacter baumannii]
IGRKAIIAKFDFALRYEEACEIMTSIKTTWPGDAPIMGLTQWLTHGGRQRADETALVFGDKRYTWRQFEDRVSRLAAVLRECGV